MAVDQPGAIPMWVPENITFNFTDATWVVIHKTAGFHTAQDCAAYFQAGSDGRNVSSHYIVGLDGTIVQCVLESRGAGANCCTESGHAAFLPDANGTSVNLNVRTISIEHIDPTIDNSTTVPPAQAAASFKLIHDICVRHNIPMRSGDATGGVIGHNQIDPSSRARCPGNYPWSDLWKFLATPAPQSSFDKMVVDLWNSQRDFFTEVYGASDVPPRDTGIFNLWRDELAQGRYRGVPISDEYSIHDSQSADPCTAQNFSGGTCVWNHRTSTGRWL